MPAQELNHQQQGNKSEEKEQNLSHNQLIRVGQFSVQINSLRFSSFVTLRAGMLALVIFLIFVRTKDRKVPYSNVKLS
jgi:hypothetical protein